MLRPLLKSLIAAAVAFTLAGCGLPEDATGEQEEAAGYPSPTGEGSALVGPGSAEAVHRKDLNRLSRGADLNAIEAVAKGPWDLSLTGALDASSGTTVTLAAAMMGCGYWIAGTAKGTVANGQIAVTVPAALSSGGYGMTAFVFVDHDGNGVCDATLGDAVFGAQVSGEGHAVLATSDLMAVEGWYCMLFNDYAK